jgi:hypothetical protein
MTPGIDHHRVPGHLPAFAPHARQKMRARKITVTEVINVIDNGSRIRLHHNRTKVEGANGIVVVFDGWGTVITVYRVAPRKIPRGRVLGPDAGVRDWRRPLSQARNRSSRRLWVVE